MKLSIAWIFDHIDAHWQDYDINLIVSKFNQTTAEIEKFYPVNINLEDFYLAQLPTIDSLNVFIPELQKKITMPERDHTFDLILKSATNIPFLIKKDHDKFLWAQLSDFGVEKDGLLPALNATEQDRTGTWREKFEHTDIIIEVDNKSITHRPDMWGHRGFAREIAAFLELPFLSKEKFLASKKALTFETTSEATQENPFIIDNQVPQACNKFNGLWFPTIENKPSDIFITSRLLKVGSRPINAIVDLTNYVTQDWSQPVHAYDADKITDKKVIIRMAKQDEKLLILDGTELSLTPDDMVIADNKKPMCLAGVKGGMHDSIDQHTKSILFEAANFNPKHVRLSAIRHKTRTDSSARFEKTLDPNQACESILRFIKLLEQCSINATSTNAVISVGPDAPELQINVKHDFLEKRTGLTLTSDDVTNLLSRLEFQVETKKENNHTTYAITVPTFRSSKDIKIKEDILEEVARLYGFNKVKLELPRIHRTPFDLSGITKSRKIRHYLAHTARMIEQQNYALYNEQSLTELNLKQPTNVTIINPVSENYSRLVYSLIPGLLKNIKENHVHQDSLNFFEFARVWNNKKKENIHEQKSIAGIFFEKRKPVDFYICKNYIEQLLITLGFDQAKISWQKIEKNTDEYKPWYRSYQATRIIYTPNEQTPQEIGIMGKIDPEFARTLDILPESDAFIFELDGNMLLHEKPSTKRYAPISRYQATSFDLSLLAPLTLTCKALEKELRDISPLVKQVTLIDYFEKEEWTDKRSLTFRILLSSNEKTLEKEEIESVRQQAINTIQSRGAELRA